MKVQNLSKAGKSVLTAIGSIQFDNNGVAEVKDEDFAKSLLELKGYEPADPNAIVEMPEEPETTEDAAPEEVDNGEEETSEEVETTEDAEAGDDTDEAGDDNDELINELNAMTVPQLRKYAKDNNIDLQGASKKDEIIPVILGASN